MSPICRRLTSGTDGLALLPEHQFGATITAVADVRQVVGVLPEVRPTAWGTVPRVWEKIKAALEAKGDRPTRASFPTR